MDLSKLYRTFLISLFSLIFLTACNSSNAASFIEEAIKIRLAINTNNVEQLRSLTSLPFIIHEQEWESAKDGAGFVLGTAKHTIISTDDLFNKTIPSFLKSLKIEGEEAITDITLTMFTSELGKNINDWAELNLILFKRGEGDVEHIVLIGLNKKTHKLNAIYVN